MLPGKFFILLDHKQDEHWKNLGLSLGNIDHRDLTGIMTSCAAQHKNPAQEVIDYLCAKDPNMPITEFKKFFDCTDTGIYRMDIIKKLDSQPGIYTIHMCHKVINTATLSQQVRGQPMNFLCRRALQRSWNPNYTCRHWVKAVKLPALNSGFMYGVVSFTQKPFKSFQLIQQGRPHAGKVRPLLFFMNSGWVGSSMSHRIGFLNMACSSAAFSEQSRTSEHLQMS